MTRLLLCAPIIATRESKRPPPYPTPLQPTPPYSTLPTLLHHTPNWVTSGLGLFFEWRKWTNRHSGRSVGSLKSSSGFVRKSRSDCWTLGSRGLSGDGRDGHSTPGRGDKQWSDPDELAPTILFKENVSVVLRWFPFIMEKITRRLLADAGVTLDRRWGPQQLYVQTSDAAGFVRDQEALKKHKHAMMTKMMAKMMT